MIRNFKRSINEGSVIKGGKNNPPSTPRPSTPPPASHLKPR